MFYDCTKITANTRFYKNSKLKKRQVPIGLMVVYCFFLFVFVALLYPLEMRWNSLYFKIMIDDFRKLICGAKQKKFKGPSFKHLFA